MLRKEIAVCIGTDRLHGVRARLSLLVMSGAEAISEHFHSIEINPGVDLAEVRRVNEEHLARSDGSIPGQPWPKIPDAEWDKVVKCVAVFHTPDVVAAHKARIAKA